MKEGNDTFKQQFNNLETFKAKFKELYAVQELDDVKTDRLASMILKQEQFQDILLRTNTKYAMMDGIPHKQVQSSALALMMEVAELIDRLPWKTWKRYSRDEEIDVYQDLNIAEEVIDCLHFIFNIWLALGFNAKDLYIMFNVKNNRNRERQKEGC